MASKCINLVKFPVFQSNFINPNRKTLRSLTKMTAVLTSLPKHKQASSSSSSATPPSSLPTRVSPSCNPSTTTTKTTSSSQLALTWRDIQGLNNWENLIQPLHPLLQREIIRYGKFVTACYDAFDLNPTSKRYLNCKYARNRMLTEVGLGDSGYEVSKYIYATPDISIPIQNGDAGARWVGYIAVSSDEEAERLGRRDILVTFRGTVTYPEWIANLMSSLSPARLDPHDPRPDVMVEAGFLSLYTSSEANTRFGLGSCREQLLSEVSRLLSRYKHEELSITLAGHSMGSSLALLLAYDIAELGLKKPKVLLTVFSFAGPRVGNVRFKERCEELGVKVLRIVNANDPVTKLPGVLFNETLRLLGDRYEFPWRCACYAHVGIELLLHDINDEATEISDMTIDRPAEKGVDVMELFKIKEILCVHDMKTYIDMIKNCPRRKRIRRKGAYFLEKISELLMSTAINVNTSPWKEVAITCFFTMVI